MGLGATTLQSGIKASKPRKPKSRDGVVLADVAWTEDGLRLSCGQRLDATEIDRADCSFQRVHACA
jgi:hypothetical protein